MPGLVLHKIGELVAWNPADSARRAEPKRLAVVRYPVDVVAEKAVTGTVLSKRALVKRVESAVHCANPKRSIFVRVERADLAAAKPFSGCEQPAFSVPVAPKAI